MIALVYLAAVAASVVLLAVVLLRSHPAPAPPPVPVAPALIPPTADAEIRVILAAVAQLADRLNLAA